ncbi:MAG: peptide-methionine (S)-S-oxide reductase MsrA [Candidatus Dormibacteria bacterium]
MEKATFAAGCFWQVESNFRQLPGVTGTAVGYTGGHVPGAGYREVCGGRTGHAEAVLVDYDPAVITYDQLLDAFWEMHDPTTVNRQGPDVGHQYRSAVFFHSPEQEAAARASIERVQPRFRKPVVTEVVSAAEFNLAEDYHQQYLEKRGVTSCAIVGAGTLSAV